MPKTLIYNIFPTLAGDLDQWEAWVDHAVDLGFNWIYLNSVFAPGASGSIFALADPFRLNPRFEPGSSGEETGGGESGISRLQRFLQRHRERGVRFMTDLNLLHCAADAPLVERHPDWIVRDASGALVHPFGPDPLDPASVSVWDDLAELDLYGAQDRPGLWRYLETVVDFWVSLGFTGFRCMHVTSVPAPLWRTCVRAALVRAHEPVLFIADALGESVDKVHTLRECGFHHLYNSSCWWQFDSDWALVQHDQLQAVAPTVSFPENHDTPRLFHKTEALTAVQHQRYLFACWFSSALQMTMGYEYCWQKPCHAVRTTPADQEPRDLDISAFVRSCNRMTRAWPMLREEGRVTAVSPLWEATLTLSKTVDGQEGRLVINKDWTQPRPVDLGGACEVCRPFRQVDGPGAGDGWSWEPASGILELAPAELVLLRS
jgi:starch synthase (maltosyl-transferring)